MTMSLLNPMSSTTFIDQGTQEAYAVIDEGVSMEEIEARAENAARTCTLHPDEGTRLRSYGRLTAYVAHLRDTTAVGPEVTQRLRRADEERQIRVQGLKEDPEKSCLTCGNRCMDMDLEPYCYATSIRHDFPNGKYLSRGRPELCGADGRLWKIDTRIRP